MALEKGGSSFPVPNAWTFSRYSTGGKGAGAFVLFTGMHTHGEWNVLEKKPREY